MVIVYAGIAAAVYSMVGLSFSLTYSTSRFFDFGHAAVLAASPYCLLLLTRTLGVPFAYALPIAVGATALLGASKEVIVYRPLRRKRTSSLVLLIASIGVYIVLQNFISLIFGDDTRLIRQASIREGYPILGARVTLVQIETVITSFVTVIAVEALLRSTRRGISMRAVGENSGLSTAVGINTDQITILSSCIGSAIAGLAGILIGLDVGITPTMGMHALLMGVVAMIIGGSGKPLGIVLGAILLAVSGQLAVQKLGSEWHDPVAFLVLLIFLLLRPRGFLGRALSGSKPT